MECCKVLELDCSRSQLKKYWTEAGVQKLAISLLYNLHFLRQCGARFHDALCRISLACHAICKLSDEKDGCKLNQFLFEFRLC